MLESDLIDKKHDIERHATKSSGRGSTRCLKSLLSTMLLFLLTPFYLTHLQTQNHSTKTIARCTIDSLHRNLSFLDNSPPITTNEFISRRNRLALALHRLNISTFVFEPGYTFEYYANVSQHDWEPWEPEERPFLMLISPVTNANGSVTARTTFLAPAFEAGRVGTLGITVKSELEIVTWEEHWNPYGTLLKSNLFYGKPAKIMVDEEMRDYIVRGLTSVGFETIGLHRDVEAVRQQKSEAEINLLRAVNTGTVEAIRAMRPCLKVGMTENDVKDVLDRALLSIPGFNLFFNLVMFDEDAASPHGGSGGNKKLEYDTMVLIDVGAHYKGYSSDVSRSLMIDPPKRLLWQRLLMRALTMWNWQMSLGDEWWIRDRLDYEEKLKAWRIVFDAQTESIKHFVPNATAASVDIAARDIIMKAGYGKHFTHRVGHGIGIKAHESPYLHKGNTGVRLRENMTFTSEPGIYLEGKFGVRHEDVFMVRAEEDGGPLLLSGRRAIDVRNP